MCSRAGGSDAFAGTRFRTIRERRERGRHSESGNARHCVLRRRPPGRLPGKDAAAGVKPARTPRLRGAPSIRCNAGAMRRTARHRVADTRRRQARASPDVLLAAPRNSSGSMLPVAPTTRTIRTGFHPLRAPVFIRSAANRSNGRPGDVHGRASQNRARIAKAFHSLAAGSDGDAFFRIRERLGGRMAPGQNRQTPQAGRPASTSAITCARIKPIGVRARHPLPANLESFRVPSPTSLLLPARSGPHDSIQSAILFASARMITSYSL